MKAVWTEATLGDVASWSSGGTPKAGTSAYYGGDIPWAVIGDLTDGPVQTTGQSITEDGLRESSAKIVAQGTLLIAMYGSIGKLGVASVPMATNQAIACAVVKEHVDARYLFQYLKAQRPKLVQAGKGGTQNNISQTILKAWPIPLPPLSEQRRIAQILDIADDLDTAFVYKQRKLLHLRRACFIGTFGSPGENPQNLPIGTVDDLVASTDYGTSEKASLEGVLPVLRMGNLTVDGDVDMTDLKYLKLMTAERYLVKSGDVLFNRTNSPDLVGKTAVYDLDKQVAYAGYLIRVRMAERQSPAYLSGFLNSGYGKAVLRNMAKSIIGMANINAKELRSIRIPIPPADLQRVYEVRLSGVRAQLARVRQEIAKADQLSAALSKRAFAGEL